MRVLVFVVVVAVLASCVVGSPPGFSSGSQWTFPLVDPLDDGLLVTQVWIKGKGPYLFAIDPEANVSIIDERIVIDAGLLIDKGFSTRLYGEDGERRIRFNAELRTIQLGNLTIESRRAIVVPHETLAASGRDIRGVLGRNVLADSLVFGFDRDRGIGWLQTASTFSPPPGATRIEYSPTRIGQNRAAQGLVHATIGGKPVVAEVQLGSAITRLRASLGQALGVGGAATTSIEFDPTGARRTLGVSATPVSISLGGLVNDHVAVAPLVDRSELPSNAMFYEATLGQSFFAPFSVVADWNDHAFYLKPRDRSVPTQLRLGRWSDLSRCQHAGCVTVTIAAAPPSTDGSGAPMSVLRVARDPNAVLPLEVRLRAANAPDLVVELPAGAAEVLAPIRGELAGARYEVVDASPFAAACPDNAVGCISER
ncbi:MAG TPA: aspartyl protease family protein [Kofleriaceae bacterium]